MDLLIYQTFLDFRNYHTKQLQNVVKGVRPSETSLKVPGKGAIDHAFIY